MGFNKIVVSGDIFELYEYDRDISQFKRNGGVRKGRSPQPVLSSSGEDSLSARRLGKRRDNAGRARMAFARLVRANLGGPVNPALFTLTYKENERDLRKAYGDFTSFVQALRYRFGASFRYVCVPEFQKRGAVHFHALFWGLPSEVVLQERRTRLFASLWGKGFLYIEPETYGLDKLVGYLAKYMTKAYVDPRLAGCKAYVASRNVLRPKVYSDVSPLWPVLDDYGLSTADLLKKKEYMTQWFGKGRYSLYQLKSTN